MKLKYLDQWTEARRINACHYHGGLGDLEEVVLPEVMEGNFHVYNQYTLRVERRDALRSHLQERGIGTGVYYPVPLHIQPCFAELGGRAGQLPESERACEEVISLPIFPELGVERMDRVVEEIRDFYAS